MISLSIVTITAKSTLCFNLTTKKNVFYFIWRYVYERTTHHKIDKSLSVFIYRLKTPQCSVIKKHNQRLKRNDSMLCVSNGLNFILFFYFTGKSFLSLTSSYSVPNRTEPTNFTLRDDTSNGWKMMGRKKKALCI